jgi:hypothetical protein
MLNNLQTIKNFFDNMAEIGFTNYFTMRKTGVIIAGLLCLAIPSVYIASERQRLVYYDPGKRSVI